MTVLRPLAFGIDLFAGAGGMSLGAELAGIKVVQAVENDANAALTYAHNFKNTNLFRGDIRNLRELSIREDRKHSPIILFGGPPCQGFSTSNQRNRSSDNPNNWLYQEFIRTIRIVNPLPEWVIFENVKGFTETSDGRFVESVIKELKKLGYSVESKILNASDFGVPQKRSRFFVVANLNNINFTFPEVKTKTKITTWEAIGDLPLLNPGDNFEMLPYTKANHSFYSDLLRSGLDFSSNHCVTKNNRIVIERYQYVKQGGNWSDIPSQLMQNYKDRSRCHTGIYHRLHPDRPSVVIGNYRKNMLIHPFQDRNLSVREAARLQSFPDYFEFHGSIGFQQQQVGNAVPPLLAKSLFEKILSL